MQEQTDLTPVWGLISWTELLEPVLPLWDIKSSWQATSAKGFILFTFHDKLFSVTTPDNVKMQCHSACGGT